MAKDFRTAIAESQQGAVAESHAYDSKYWGRDRAFSQVIADATRGVDAGMNRFTPQKPDTSSSRYAPDWRGHYLGQELPAHACDIKGGMVARKYDDSEARDDHGRWARDGGDGGVFRLNGPTKAHIQEALAGKSFFHGTSAAAIQSIMQKGLVPKGGTGADAWAHQHNPLTTLDLGDSRRASVYITPRPSLAKDFAELAGQVTGSPPAILKVTIPKAELSHITPDERMGFADPTSALRYIGTIKPEWIKPMTADEMAHVPDGPLAYLAKADGDLVFYVVVPTTGGAMSAPDFNTVHKYSPDQPRDEVGRWTDGGGDAAGGKIDFNSIRDHYLTEPGFGGDPAIEDLKNQTYADEADQRAYMDIHPAESPGGATFSSPNQGEKDFATATADLDGPRQKAFKQAANEIDGEMGMPHTNTDIVGAWKDGAENSLLTESADNNMANLKFSAAMKGYLGNQKAVLVFSSDQNGKSAMYDMELPLNAKESHDALLTAGVENHTLFPISPDYTRVVVVDTDGSLGKAVSDLAAKHEVTALRTFGNAEFIGDTQGTGTDAEQRDRARQAYQQVIDASASSKYLGRSGAQLWQGVRDRWGPRIQALKRRLRLA